MELNALFIAEIVSINPKGAKGSGRGGAKTYVDITEVTDEDPHSSNFIRNPNPRRAIPTPTREINPARSPLHIPDGFTMTSIDHDILVRFERPQSDRRVVRGGEEIAWWGGCSRDRIEGEGVDWARVGDQFARGRSRFVLEFLQR